MNLDFLDNRAILVTGGTGSFGQKFIRTLLARSRASKIIVLSRDELKQSQMMSSIADPDGRLRFFLGDVRDINRLERAFRGIDYVVHAAALKQVPMLEYNPFEAVQTNIIGTQNVITAALNQGVKKVLLVSTDKAANPANLYGATKLCAERLVIASNAYAGFEGTCVAAVRYGKVLGSRGSILNLIEEQKKTGEVLLTHEEMTRFWITLDQGVALVLTALEKMHGGEIFVPKIPSMKIKDFLLAIAPESRIRIIGIRPGEKLHEVLVTPEEARHAKEYDTHFVILQEAEAARMEEQYRDGKPLPDGFSFASHTNALWLDPDGLRRLIASAE
jgi:UDP-N-acetylglucosamine 4,6-dehydratase